MNKQELASKLKAYRKEHGMTQIGMVKLLDVSLPTYRLWETGVGNPNEENMQRVKQLLGE